MSIGGAASGAARAAGEDPGKLLPAVHRVAPRGRGRVPVFRGGHPRLRRGGAGHPAGCGQRQGHGAPAVAGQLVKVVQKPRRLSGAEPLVVLL
jgi:hypothetical protein